MRAAEERGDIPRYSEATRSAYRDFAFVWCAARAGGATPEAIRRVMGSFNRGGGEEVRDMSQESVYPAWRRMFIAEADGTPIASDKRRVEVLMPHFLRGMRHPVVIPRGSASDFELPPEAKDVRWWGAGSGNGWFGDFAYSFGMLNARVDLPEGILTGKEGGSK